MLTQDRLWSEAVILEAGENRVLRVQSTRDAFLCLKNHWPIADGKAKRHAFTACERVIDGDDEPDVARAAFIKAAEEAQFSVHSWTG
ncbi:hypothetical protein SM0020_04360 [Sinorhizobium meliloti CCNWSX0020]|uniref:DUF982 domain-containing protein n=2 Tax=Sinorhizobium TaxID=28105 RepID=H0FUN0_RHIML|nr:MULTISPECIES: DUF982 domain-containing protein [Sinorhizobium]PII38403.1 hypothetical protein T190_21110 [Sinorhizobium meliloti CCBAU 01290]EHK79215.1 hypothetical protein SM0020_04360 [Sinorhizobium meliloti CCNWSX0020]RVE93015.1 DUF982 domain-containing protein [Sinorhizobium meliloti]RVG76052.1 DUF982 domain-containing protein [Sinorhizobium meliloti]RVG76253.1 DUF982 domain-containing protein [Sinorhizobium meliloti]